MTSMWGKKSREEAAGGDPGDITGASMRSLLTVPQEIAAMRERFGFLVQDFGFEEVDHRSGTYESSVAWQGEHTGVKVIYSQRDGVQVEISRLVTDDSGAKIIPVEGSGYATPLTRDAFDLRLVLKFRVPEVFEALTAESRHMKFPQALERLAELLKLHCQDMLAGDFQFFEVLNQENTIAVRRMREEAGFEPL